MKDVLRFATMENGVQSVMISGTLLMHKWSVVS